MICGSECTVSVCCMQKKKKKKNTKEKGAMICSAFKLRHIHERTVTRLVFRHQLIVLNDFLWQCPTRYSHHRTDGTFLSFSISLKVTVAEILMDSTGSQADMSPLSTIATITLPWSIVVHDSLYKGPILRPLPTHLFLPHFQSSLPPRLIYNSTSFPLILPSLILLISPVRPPFPFFTYFFPELLHLFLRSL